MMVCPICNSEVFGLMSGYDDRYGYPGTFQILKCRSCGHAFLQGEFSPEKLRDLYSNYYPRSTFNLEQHQPYKEASGLKAWLNGEQSSAFRWVPRNVSVLDIGCGFGESLGYHKARGCDAYGVEADENIRRVADKFGYNVRVGLFDPTAYEKESFDYVTMSQVIEHVTDPVQTLRGIVHVLKPGGTAILSTPNANGLGARIFGKRWINWHTPYHLQFFSLRSMQLAAEQAGLVLEKVATITPSAWLCYQWIHLLSYPQEGKPSVFWASNSSKPGWHQILMRRLILSTQLILLPQLISRLVDSTGQGDSYLFVLKKV